MEGGLEGCGSSHITAMSCDLFPAKCWMGSNKAPGMDWENNPDSSQKLPWGETGEEQRKQDVFKAGEAPAREKPETFLLSRGGLCLFLSFPRIFSVLQDPHNPP